MNSALAVANDEAQGYEKRPGSHHVPGSSEIKLRTEVKPAKIKRLRRYPGSILQRHPKN